MAAQLFQDKKRSKTFKLLNSSLLVINYYFIDVRDQEDSKIYKKISSLPIKTLFHKVFKSSPIDF